MTGRALDGAPFDDDRDPDVAPPPAACVVEDGRCVTHLSTECAAVRRARRSAA